MIWTERRLRLWRALKDTMQVARAALVGLLMSLLPATGLAFIDRGELLLGIPVLVVGLLADLFLLFLWIESQ